MSCPECRGLSGYHFRYGHCWGWEVSVRRRPFPQRICCLAVLTGHTQKAEMTTTSLFLETGGRGTMERKQRSGRRKAERWNLPAEREEQVRGPDSCSRLWVKYSFLLGQYQPTPPGAGQATPYLAFRKSLWPVPGSILSLWCLHSLFGTTMVPWYTYIYTHTYILPWFSGGSHLQRSLRKGPRLHSPDQYKSPSS